MNEEQLIQSGYYDSPPICPMCKEEIYEPSKRKDALGRRWCLKCEEHFDSIDHDTEEIK